MVLLTGAHITKILFEDTQGSDVVATGVEFLKDGRTLVAKAKREVVVCAGSRRSPLIANECLSQALYANRNPSDSPDPRTFR